MDGYWIIRTYESGAIGEKTKFYIRGDREKRSQRRERNAIKKQQQNEYAAEKALARLINANFSQGDILLGLDYSEPGMEKLRTQAIKNAPDFDDLDDAEKMELIRDAAARELKLVIRRVKRELGEDSLKYIAITSDMDGDTGESVRVHHHLIISRSAREVFLSKWKLGGVDWSTLSGQQDYTQIAEYLIKQVRKIPDAKKYVSSRNLIRPVPKDRVAFSGAEIKVPKGAKILFRNAYKPGWPQYVRYILPKKQNLEELEE